jgi:hypothetical protein
MKQKINATQPTLSPSLEKVRDRFETWRRRKKPGSRIPKAMWQAAVESCKGDSVLQVSRALRLNYNDLKARVDAAEEVGNPGPDCDLDFVQLGFRASILPSECTLELEASNGAKMKIGFRGAVDALALCDAFWRQGS